MCSGGIGVLVGLAIANWIGLAFIGVTIGAIFGGIIGVSVLCWKEIRQNAPYVWKKVSGWKLPKFLSAKEIGERIVNSLIVLTTMILLFEAIAFIFIIGCQIDKGTIIHNSTGIGIAREIIGSMLIIPSCFAGVLTFVIGISLSVSKLISPSDDRESRDDINDARKIVWSWKWNPISAPFTCGFYALCFVCREIAWFIKASPVCLPQLASKVWHVIVIPYRFVKEMWILIHTDTVVCLFVDVCIGVFISWCLNWHTPIQYVYAGLLGAGIAGFNYRLVAVGWLKVQPAEA